MAQRRGRWPNLFVAGAPRAGTSSLWHYLRQHPDIFMSDPKETHFFSELRQSIVPDIRDEASYLALFRSAREPVVGEATPTYVLDQGAAARISERSPAAKIVISLREPGERARSKYWHGARYFARAASFADIIEAELKKPPEARMNLFRYADSVERFLERFDHVHVLFLEELQSDVRGEVRRLYDFVGVDPGFASRIDVSRLNAYGVPRNRVVRAAYQNRRLRSATRRLVPARFESRFERALLDKTRQTDTDSAVLERIRAAYDEDISRLESLLGRSVPWREG